MTRFFLGLIVVLISTGAGASPLTNLLVNRTNDSSAGSNGSPAELTPARQVTGRVRIEKMAIAKNASGEYEFKATPICQKDVQIDVFDLRNFKSGDRYTYSYKKIATCDADFLGTKVEVSIAAAVVLRMEVLFNGESPADHRVNSASLQSVDASGIYKQHAMTQSLSRDLTGSAILSANESNNWKCETNGTCGPTTVETFHATIEFGP